MIDLDRFKFKAVTPISAQSKEETTHRSPELKDALKRDSSQYSIVNMLLREERKLFAQ